MFFETNCLYAWVSPTCSAPSSRCECFMRVVHHPLTYRVVDKKGLLLWWGWCDQVQPSPGAADISRHDVVVFFPQWMSKNASGTMSRNSKPSEHVCKFDADILHPLLTYRASKALDRCGPPEKISGVYLNPTVPNANRLQLSCKSFPTSATLLRYVEQHRQDWAALKIAKNEWTTPDLNFFRLAILPE